MEDQPASPPPQGEGQGGGVQSPILNFLIKIIMIKLVIIVFF